MGYSDGFFARLDPERRLLRNAVRDRFFSDLNVERRSDPFVNAPRSDVQKTIVETLLMDTLQHLGTDSEAVEMVLNSMRCLGLGDQGLTQSQSTLLFSALSPTAFAANFFINHWGNQPNEAAENS